MAQDTRGQAARSTRRTLLRRGAVVVAGVAAAQWLRRPDELDARPPRVFDAPSEPPLLPPRTQFEGPTCTLLAVGDIGWPTEARAEVSRGLARVHRELGADAVLLLGDNFYRDGIDSVDSRRWQDDFELVYPIEDLDLEFVAALGNHDHNGNVMAQIEYTQRSTRWSMPGSYHARSFPIGGAATLDVFVLDTIPIRLHDTVAEAQLRWLTDKLERSTARWRVIVGHHPILSNGSNGGSSVVRRSILPLIERYDIDLYLSGHEHDIQLIDSGDGWLQAIAGTGSGGRSTRWGSDSLFAEVGPGFLALRASEDLMELEFHREHEVLFRHAVAKPVELAATRPPG